MKINKKFKVHNAVGEHIILLQGRTGGDMTSIVALNDTAYRLWNHFYELDFSIEDVKQYLLDNYEVEADVALKDAEMWVEEICGHGLLLEV